MGRRTLVSCWKQFEKLSRDYMDPQKDRVKTLDLLNELTRKANRDDIGNALHTLFITPFYKKSSNVQFAIACDGDDVGYRTSFDEDSGIIYVNPVSVYHFIQDIRNIEQPINQDDFIFWRNNSFLVEIGKMINIHILFLLVLQRVAYLLQIAHLEKRGGVIEIAEDESYHTLLWAFKELEVFLKKTYGLNIRAHCGISWYEAEWITGR